MAWGRHIDVQARYGSGYPPIVDIARGAGLA
jgi:hypothetical protein